MTPSTPIYFRAFCLCLMLGSCAHFPAGRQETAATPPVPVVLSINDVYRLKGLHNGATGGLPRVLALRQRLLGEGHPVLLLHAGDFLYPSFMSRVFQGEAMIQGLNRLDNAPGHFDPLMFVTFGNHEFDKSRIEHASLLNARIAQSEFTWLDSNIRWKKDSNGQPLIKNPRLKKWALIALPAPDGPVRVGIFSITTDMAHPQYIERFESPAATAARFVPLLRAKGADMVIALTHHPLEQDKKLLQLPIEHRPDIIFGGHEHYHQLELVNGRWIAKADADALSAMVTPVEKTAKGLHMQPTRIELDSSIKPNPDLLRYIENWHHRMAQAYCNKQGKTADCLNVRYGTTRVELIGEESEIRRFETNLGNFIADTALQGFRACGAQLAVINSGSIRLNQNISANSPITSAHLETMFAYPSPLKLIRINGATLKKMLAHNISSWTASGHWLLIAGFRFVHDPENQRFYRLQQADGRPVNDDDPFLMVVPEYLISPHSDHDGYDMIDASQVVNCPLNGTELKNLLIQRIKQSPEGIAPHRDGRICNTLRDDCSRLN